MQPLRVMPFCGCQLNSALRPLLEARRVVSTTNSAMMKSAAYTMAENLQRLRFVRGEVEIPQWLRFYCNLPEDVGAGADRLRNFERADIVLLEPNTTINIFFGPYALHRSNVSAGITDKVGTVSDELRQACSAWWYQGVFARNRQAQHDAARTIIPALTGRVDDERVARKILLEARGGEQDFERYQASLAEFCEIVDLPIGLVTFVYAFLPDGRPMGWPAEFIEDTVKAAKSLELPILDSAEIVSRHGVETAMDENRMLYTKEFLPTVAEEVFRFCGEVLARANAGNVMPARAAAL